MEDTTEKKCGCPCHKMAGVFVALIGVMFLLQNLGVLSANLVGIIWPVLLILAGVKSVFKGMCKCCRKG
jgi:Domain of unknown function (DUF5668)